MTKSSLHYSPLFMNIFNVRASILLLLIFSGCYSLRPSGGGGKTDEVVERVINPKDVALPDGYVLSTLARNLTYPSGIDIDEQGNVYIIEAGYAYGEDWAEPRLIKVDSAGTITVIATGKKDDAPWNGIDYHDGNFYIAAGGQLAGGKILKIDMQGNVTPLLQDLPSYGDHHTNGPVVMNQYLYFGQGTATNAGVVGEDNYQFGWLKRKPEFHDIPCEDIILRGKNYQSPNVLQPGGKEIVFTGAYQPFKTPSADGQVVRGQIPCTGSVMRISLAGGKPELVAWGLRNPFGLATYQHKLFLTENSYDQRGSRPVWGAGDVLWEVNQGDWYGWPDYAAGKKIYDDEEFKTPGKPKVKPVLKNPVKTPPKPLAILGVHSSSAGIDFSTSAVFGFPGEAFIAQFGDMATGVGKTLSPVGFKVVRVDITTGVIHDFAVNKGRRNGPASWLKTGGLERPVAVKFSKSGNALYILDFGVMRMDGKQSIPQQKTGVLWKIIQK